MPSTARIASAVSVMLVGFLVQQTFHIPLVWSLQVHPDCRQAAALKSRVDDQIVKDGLIGVGLGVGVLGLVGLVIGGILSGSGSRR